MLSSNTMETIKDMDDAIHDDRTTISYITTHSNSTIKSSPMMITSSSSGSSCNSPSLSSSHYHQECPPTPMTVNNLESNTNNNNYKESVVLDQLAAMHSQDKGAYSYCCFFPSMTTPSSSSPKYQCLDGDVVAQEPQQSCCCAFCSNHHDYHKINVSWREKICHWSYNVVDHFDISREVVAISLKLFDRYLATRDNKCNGNLALLASLTTLHIAIKLHESKKIKLDTLASLSRGQFHATHIEDMEWEILSALKWKVHPPTEYSFLQHFVQLLESCQDEDDEDRENNNNNNSTTRYRQSQQQQLLDAGEEGMNPKEMLELSKYLTELCICDAFFAVYPSSIVAFAALLNVMEDMPRSRLSSTRRTMFVSLCATKFKLREEDPCVTVARQRIQAMLREASGGERSSTAPSSTTTTTGLTSTTNNRTPPPTSTPPKSHTNNKKMNQAHFEPPRSSTPSSTTRRMSSSSDHKNRMPVDTTTTTTTTTDSTTANHKKNHNPQRSTTTTSSTTTTPFRELSSTTVVVGVTRPRADSSDSMCSRSSKGSSVAGGSGGASSYRYSPSPRRNRVPSSFTMGRSRGRGRHRLSSSPIVAGVQ